jgi:hypothetical protein
VPRKMKPDYLNDETIAVWRRLRDVALKHGYVRTADLIQRLVIELNEEIKARAKGE